MFVHELIQKNEQKDIENRAIYANKIATERDVNLEIEYAELQAQLTSDRIFHQFSADIPMSIELGTLSAILEKRRDCARRPLGRRPSER